MERENGKEGGTNNGELGCNNITVVKDNVEQSKLENPWRETQVENNVDNPNQTKNGTTQNYK